MEKTNEIIKQTFKGREDLLKTMRALFFGLETTDDEKNEIKSIFSNPEVFKVIRQKFLPEISKDTEIGQLADVWLGAESLVFDKAPSTVKQAIGYKAQSIILVEKALNLLLNPDGEKIDISFKPNEFDELGIELLARNQYIRHMESQLLFIWVIAHQDSVSPEELKKRLRQDSAE